MIKYITTHKKRNVFVGVRYNKKSFIIETDGVEYTMILEKKELSSKKRKVSIHSVSKWCTDYIRAYMESETTEETLSIDEIQSLIRVKFGLVVRVEAQEKEGVVI